MASQESMKTPAPLQTNLCVCILEGRRALAFRGSSKGGCDPKDSELMFNNLILQVVATLYYLEAPQWGRD